jgi:DNA-directed RNA polymerase omega subunit
MIGTVDDRRVSIEKCLDVIPNKFELSLVAMNRARDVLLGAKCSVEATRFAKKSVNRVLSEIEQNSLDLVAMKDKIKRDLLTNNLFLKGAKSFPDDDITGVDDALMDLETKGDDVQIDLDEDDGKSDEFSGEADAAGDDDNLPEVDDTISDDDAGDEIDDDTLDGDDSLDGD